MQIESPSGYGLAERICILSQNKQHLFGLLLQIDLFLRCHLRLALHPQKVFIKTFASSVDFLGLVHFPYHRMLRSATKQRMMIRIKEHTKSETLQSYLGLLKHGNTFNLTQEIIPYFDNLNNQSKDDFGLTEG